MPAFATSPMPYYATLRYLFISILARFRYISEPGLFTFAKAQVGNIYDKSPSPQGRSRTCRHMVVDLRLSGGWIGIRFRQVQAQRDQSFSDACDVHIQCFQREVD